MHGAKSEKAENLFYLAMDLDADPARQRMRQAIADGDLGVLLELGSPENVPKLAPGSVFVLSAALWDSFPEHKPDVYRIYDQALRLYPGDYVLQSVGGTIYDVAGRVESALMCRSSALSIRPHDPVALFRLGESLSFLGRLTDAEGALRASIAADPRSLEAFWSLGVVQSQLGDRNGALETYSRALEIRDDPDLRADMMGIRFQLGLASRDDMVALAKGANTALGLVNALYPLLDHPDPARRDPQFVLRMIEERGGLLRQDDIFFLLNSVAHVRAADWRGALAAIEGRYYQAKLQLVTPNAFDFMRSLIYSHLGNVEAAHECYARGVAEWNGLTAGNPGAWEKSDVMRWRREAEEALPK